jgi:hypothetical protein
MHFYLLLFPLFPHFLTLEKSNICQEWMRICAWNVAEKNSQIPISIQIYTCIYKDMYPETLSEKKINSWLPCFQMYVLTEVKLNIFYWNLRYKLFQEILCLFCNVVFLATDTLGFPYNSFLKWLMSQMNSHYVSLCPFASLHSSSSLFKYSCCQPLCWD